MITIQQAKSIICSAAPPSRVVTVPLLQAHERILAKDIYATIDIPAYPQSSMDGYAIRYADREQPLQIGGVIKAGDTKPQQLHRGYAMRIFTGAPLPEGADTIIIQEKTTVSNGLLTWNDAQLAQGQHVRQKGAEIGKGGLATPVGTYLSAAALGFIAGIGYAEVPVFAPPRVTLIITGDELQRPGQPLEYGQVYEANSVQLSAVLKKAGVKDIHITHATDIKEQVHSALTEALLTSDLVLVTGGVSVGDYDFVAEAVAACGVSVLFHKIKQKPGKPLLFGKKDNTVVFGLPGNPSSALTCFYEYVLPLIEDQMHAPRSVISVTATAAALFRKPAGLTHFIKATCTDGKVTALHAQESFRLHSFATANCFLVLPEESNGCEAGDIVEVHMLPI